MYIPILFMHFDCRGMWAAWIGSKTPKVLGEGAMCRSETIRTSRTFGTSLGRLVSFLWWVVNEAHLYSQVMKIIGMSILNFAAWVTENPCAWPVSCHDPNGCGLQPPICFIPLGFDRKSGPRQIIPSSIVQTWRLNLPTCSYIFYYCSMISHIFPLEILYVVAIIFWSGIPHSLDSEGFGQEERPGSHRRRRLSGGIPRTWMVSWMCPEGCRRMPKDAHGFWWFTMTKLRTVIFHSEITGHSKFANNDRPRFVCVPTGFVWKYTPFHQLLYLLEELSFNFGQSQLVSTPLGWPRTTRFLEVMVTAAEALPFLQCRWWVGKQGFQLTQETDGDAAGEVFGMGGFN